MKFDEPFHQSQGIELEKFECGYGARTIINPPHKGGVDSPFDRTARAGTDTEHWEELKELLNDGQLTKIFGLMGEAVPCLNQMDETTVVLINEPRYLVTCNPQASGGYLYLFIGRRTDEEYDKWMKKASNPRCEPWKQTVSEREVLLADLVRE